ncbi:UNKNOWN [Stylonychia lemnae]|uniref:Transcription factor CBF/NF-Y/archaeal histone domain-containing protein n=1 Tax=Stylonychia lemnae TaxID=5949 RepID=A0A078ARS5_STYLE|nr:UNKNOWN [Stylonychia lemnae]|eukprot:CDW85190.1 UNKNOWN [Stylonychia lemnae]
MISGQYDDDYLRHLAELTDKWNKLKDEIDRMPKSKNMPSYSLIDDLEQFKDQKLPLARIKKIMKSDEDVRMISAEAPILFAKACEMFIIEMTHKAYYYAKKNNRKTLQRNDIAAAITDTEIYDFLLDIMPRDEIINNAKDKQLSQGMQPQSLIGGNAGVLNHNQIPPSSNAFSSVNGRNQGNQQIQNQAIESEDEQEVENAEDQIQGSAQKSKKSLNGKEESKDQVMKGDQQKKRA